MRRFRTETEIKTLIVEDEAIIAMDLRETVERAGYEVLSVFDSAFEAIEYLRSNAVELVLLDMMLSDGATGPDVARVCDELSVAYVPMTGANHSSSAFAAARNASRKPFSSAQLHEALSAVAR